MSYDDEPSYEDRLEDDQQAEQDTEIIKKHVKMLQEHFPDVQIFAIRRSDITKDTYTFSDGSGNWSARYGFVKEWVIQQEESFRAKARRDFDEETR